MDSCVHQLIAVVFLRQEPYFHHITILFYQQIGPKNPLQKKMGNSIQLIFHLEKLWKVEQNENNITF